MFVLLVVILIILLILALMSDRACNVGSVPPTEDNDIDGCLMHYVTTTNDPFDYGSYNALNRSKAVIAEGLLQSSELIVGLFNVQPQGRFCPEQLKRRICKMVDDNNALNTSSFNNVHFSRWAACQMSVMLAHTRRVMRNDTRYQQAVSSLEPEERQRFDEFLTNCQWTKDSQETQASSSDLPPPKRCRKLKFNVSTDSQGYPRMSSIDLGLEASDADSTADDEGNTAVDDEENAAVDDAEFEEDENNEKAGYGSDIDWAASALLNKDDDAEENPDIEDENDDQDDNAEENDDTNLDMLATSLVYNDKLEWDNLLGEAESIAKKPSKHVPAPRGGQKALALKKRPAAQELSARRGHSSVLGEIDLSCCTQKSYLRHMVDGKWVHIVTVRASQTDDHCDLATKLFKHVIAHPLDKKEIVEQKDKWIDEMNSGASVKDLGSDSD